jgi:chromosome segregation ATPase
MSMSSSLFRQK